MIAIRIDTPTYLERVDNERPPVEVEDEEGLRSTTSFVNEFYATTYVYPVSYALDDINGTDEPLQPLQSLGDVVNALRHFALQEEEAAITRIQGTPLVLSDVSRSETDPRLLSVLINRIFRRIYFRLSRRQLRWF